MSSDRSTNELVRCLPSRNFRPGVYGLGAWTDNLPFAYDLIATLQLRLLVELGTDRGESYFAFCQSIVENRLTTRSFAVDTWLGDQHAGGYDETTFVEVSVHNRAHYESFSTLLRCSFDEALRHFASESIDLLHLDGLHTEAAVHHDVETWLPKIRTGGILLMHDVGVQGRGFGVAKVWEELKKRGRSYTFRMGPGLGIWQKPPTEKLPEPIEKLLGGTREEVASLTEYYRDRARELQERIVQQWRDGSIRETAAARQTTIQVFYTNDGIHREDDSIFARIGHESWKDILLQLPRGAGTAPLRIDFLSAYTVIDLNLILLANGDSEKFRAEEPRAFDEIRIAGDAERLPHPHYLRLKITGSDPQLYLPSLDISPNESSLQLRLRLRVSVNEPRD